MRAGAKGREQETAQRYKSFVTINGPPWAAVHRAGKIAMLRICGQILFGSAADILSAIGDAEKIFVSIDSTGGDLAIGVALYEGLHGRDAEATVTGSCFSAAVPILLACQKRIATPGSRLMVHQGGAHAFGTVDDLLLAASNLGKLNRRLHQILSESTGEGCATIDAWLDRDTYFTPQQALKVGLITGISEPEPSTECHAQGGPSEPAKTEDETAWLAFLAAFGKIRVNSKDRFLKSTLAHLHSNVHENTFGSG